MPHYIWLTSLPTFGGFSEQPFKHQHFHIQNEAYVLYSHSIPLLGVYPLEVDTDVRNEYIRKYLLQKIGNDPTAHQ